MSATEAVCLIATGRRRLERLRWRKDGVPCASKVKKAK
jgi:hypothetical protein